MARHFTKYPSNYVKASTYDTSKYKIVGFTPSEYERLKQFVASDSMSSDNTFGFIERIDMPFAIDVLADQIGDNIEPEWNTYELHPDPNYPDYNDCIDGGTMDLSLSYDEQVDYLISELEKTIARYNR